MAWCAPSGSDGGLDMDEQGTKGQTSALQNLVDGLLKASDVRGAAQHLAEVVTATLQSVLPDVELVGGAVQFRRDGQELLAAMPDSRPSGTLRRAVEAAAAAALLDVRTGTVLSAESRFTTGHSARMEFQSHSVHQQRGTTHQLGLPMKGPQGVLGVCIIELKLPDTMPTSLLTRVVPNLQMLADVTAVLLRHVPDAPAEVPESTHPLPVVGQTMRALLARMARFVAEPDALLLLGEPGVGKRFVAEWCHHQHRHGSFRAWKPTGSGEVGADLVGWRRGAFEGARSDQPGLLESFRGTLFIDEVDRLSLGVQDALVHLLDTGTVRRLGTPQPRRAQVRLIFGATTDPHTARDAGNLRPELALHLASACFEVPPLRQRTDEIAGWIDHHLAGQRMRPDERALAALQAWAWPGNLHELIEVCRRIRVLARPPEQTHRVWPIGLEVVRQALQGSSNTLDLKEIITGAASAFVSAAVADGGFDLKLADAFSGMVLTQAEQIWGRKGASELFGRARDVELENHHRLFKRAERQVQALEAHLAAASQKKKVGPTG